MELEFELTCGEHCTEASGSDVMSRLEEGEEYPCPECGRSLDVAAFLEFECVVCSDVFHASSLDEAGAVLGIGCLQCDERGFGSSWLAIPYSRQASLMSVDWAMNEANTSEIRRADRNDYWEGVMHFCDEREFVSICRGERIRAAKTGYFKEPAVCLSETPDRDWDELRRRHGDCGFLFRKRDILAADGGPVVYLPEKLIQDQKGAGGFAVTIRPFVNLLRTKANSQSGADRRHDFLFEREWRVPADIELRRIVPIGVMVADTWCRSKSHRAIADAIIQFGLIQAQDDDSIRR